MDPCVICESASKYRCPACLRCTCSLPCVRQHKDKFECTGHRASLSYKPKSALKQETQLAQDYQFLLSAPRLDASRKPASSNNRDWLVRAGQQRGIHIERLPPTFTKHRQNRTRLVRDILVWSVQVTDLTGGQRYLMIGEQDELWTKLGIDKTDDVALFMKMERCKERKVAVNRPCCLKELLPGKRVIEFPEFIIKNRDTNLISTDGKSGHQEGCK